MSPGPVGSSMIRYHANWIVPVTAPPIRDGWVSVEGDTIAGVGAAHEAPAPARQVDLGAVAIVPGLVNAHTHLELSWTRGRIGRQERFTDWIRMLLALRRERQDPADPVIGGAAARGIDEARRCGTALIGDISNTLITAAPLRARAMNAVVFHELLGFNVEDPVERVARARSALNELPPSANVRTTIAAHAPYSVAPDLFVAIRRDLDRHPQTRSSVHLAESPEEVEFLSSGTGPWRAILEELGAWNPRWTPPRSAPSVYLEQLGFVGPRVLVVHGVQLQDHELQRLAARRMTIVTCPRGNLRTGAGAPPVDRFYRSGVNVAIGTDSLASVDDLNVFSELAALRTIAPRVPASALLASATRWGAEALGLGAELGAIAPGLRAQLLAVEVPCSETNVEEYLVRGVAPEQLRWLDAEMPER